jgi:hypothetical protein
MPTDRKEGAMTARVAGIFLLVALLVFMIAHVVVVVRVGLVAKAMRADPESSSLAKKLGPVRLVVSLFVPPLAPYYAWALGEGAFAVAWIATLAVYVVAMAIS